MLTKMKNIILMSLFACSSNLFAESATLVEFLANGQEKEMEHSGYIAPVVKYTSIVGRDSALVGGRAAWLINNETFLGVAAYSLANYRKLPRDPQRRELDITMLGFHTGYNLFTDWMIHPSFSAFIGWGSISAENEQYTLTATKDANSRKVDDRITVFEPEVAAEANVTNYLRATVGLGYRFVSGSSKALLKTSEIEAFSLTFGLNFGSF